jgi:ubiquitin-activating enzyme E1
VFGKPMHDAITRLSFFVVGAGAIGCELLKNLALMGVATAEDVTSGDKAAASSTSTSTSTSLSSSTRPFIHVTDMDSIEKSNLNRRWCECSGDLHLCYNFTNNFAHF